jgi:hypothetical protein
MSYRILFLFLIATTVISCKKYEVTPGNDPNFTIIENTDTDFKKFNKKVLVFNIPIYATKKVENEKLLHTANILAQYLDNNEDGIIDNPLIVEKMISSEAYLFMWKTKTDQKKAPTDKESGQDLGADETNPFWHSNGHIGEFDASLEEVWHLISHIGYAQVYPNIFGEHAGTSLSNAMDIARGGNFTSIPSPYPEDAWYSYDDTTCEYDCMTTEYFYWSLTSILGAQENRLDEIQNEWKLNTASLVEDTDQSIYNLLMNSSYMLPSVLPDGTYNQ